MFLQKGCRRLGVEVILNASGLSMCLAMVCGHVWCLCVFAFGIQDGASAFTCHLFYIDSSRRMYSSAFSIGVARSIVYYP
jgi:hypothetical protein